MIRAVIASVMVVVSMLSAETDIAPLSGTSIRDNNLVYDGNVSIVHPVQNTINTLRDSNLSELNLFDKRENISPDIKVFSDGRSMRIFEVPRVTTASSECLAKSQYDWGTDTNGTNSIVDYIAKRTVYSYDRKSAFLSDSNLTNAEILTTKCIEVWKSGSDPQTEEGGMLCGDCSVGFNLSMSTAKYDDNGSLYYVPNNKALAQAYSHAEREDQSKALIQRMFNKSTIARGVSANNLLTVDLEVEE